LRAKRQLKGARVGSREYTVEIGEWRVGGRAKRRGGCQVREKERCGEERERESGVCQVEICSGNKLNDGDAKVPTDSSYTATPGRLGETSGAGEEVSTRVSAY
jgi:hypothetical protein